MVSDVLDIFIRSTISIAVLFTITKLIGKKHIAQLSFFDYIAGIVVGSIASSLSVEKNVSYIHGITALITWGIFSYLVALISLKSMQARRFFDSTPKIFIRNGRIVEENLRKEKININDFLEELRLKGVFNINNVEFAILETNGEISLMLKSQKRPITPGDINIPTTYEGLSANLIIDGIVMRENLKQVNLNEEWLSSELTKKNINSIKDVLLASLDTEGKLYITSKRKKNTHESNILE